MTAPAMPQAPQMDTHAEFASKVGTQMGHEVLRRMPDVADRMRMGRPGGELNCRLVFEVDPATGQPQARIDLWSPQVFDVPLVITPQGMLAIAPDPRLAQQPQPQQPQPVAGPQPQYDPAAYQPAPGPVPAGVAPGAQYVEPLPQAAQPQPVYAPQVGPNGAAYYPMPTPVAQPAPPQQWAQPVAPQVPQGVVPVQTVRRAPGRLLDVSGHGRPPVGGE